MNRILNEYIDARLDPTHFQGGKENFQWFLTSLNHLQGQKRKGNRRAHNWTLYSFSSWESEWKEWWHGFWWQWRPWSRPWGRPWGRMWRPCLGSGAGVPLVSCRLMKPSLGVPGSIPVCSRIRCPYLGRRSSRSSMTMVSGHDFDWGLPRAFLLRF